MKAYSVDLRRRIVDAVDNGMTEEAAARTFSVSVSTVKNYLRQRPLTGSIAPKPHAGGPALKVSDETVPALIEQLPAHPNDTLRDTVLPGERTQQ